MKQKNERVSVARLMRRYRAVRGAMFFLAALPIFQGISACGTGVSQVLGGVANALPSLSYNAAQSVFLLPFEIALALATGRDPSNIGNGGSGGIGGSSLTGSTGI